METKKNYLSPDIETLEVDMHSLLMAGSDICKSTLEINDENINNFEILSKPHDSWDEWE